MFAGSDGLSPGLEARAFAVDRAGILVIMHSEEDRLSQFAGRGPFCEFHLDNDARRHPMNRLIGAESFGKWRRPPLESPKPPPQIVQGFAGESAARVADIVEHTSAVVVSEEDRTEMRPGSSWFGVAANDELFSV